MSETSAGETRRLSPLFTWRGAIVESDLPPTVRHVALTLSMHMNERGGSCFPSHDTLKRETGLGRSTVIEALGKLEALGWLVRHRGSAGRSTTYEASVPVQELDTSSSRTVTVQELDSDRPGAGHEVVIEDAIEDDIVSPPTPQSTELIKVAPSESNRPAKVDRKRVTDDEYELAFRLLEFFNSEAGTGYRSKDYIAKIIMRIREHPTLGPREHAVVVRRALQQPWWTGQPSPSVVWGNAPLYERAIHAATAPPDPDRPVTAKEAAEFGTVWGPGTPYATPAEAALAAISSPTGDDVVEATGVIEHDD